MKEIRLPYGYRNADLCIFRRRIWPVCWCPTRHSYQARKTGAELVEDSLDHPIGSPRLEELAKGKKNIVIISSDHTRPVPSAINHAILLRRIRSVAPDARIRILVATGFHRASTREELVAKYGEEVVDHEEIVMHDARDDAAMVDVGVLPSGGHMA